MIQTSIDLYIFCQQFPNYLEKNIYLTNYKHLLRKLIFYTLDNPGSEQIILARLNLVSSWVHVIDKC